MANNMRAKERVVVCAAIKHKAKGTIICGARHGNCLNQAVALGIDGSPSSETWECGFVDADNVFMSRKEAWIVADNMGQIRRPCGFEKDFSNQREKGVGDSELLFSENLY